MNFLFRGNYPVETSMSTLSKTVLRAMKLTALLLLTSCLQVSAIPRGQSISLTGKNVALQTVFSAIKKQTGYDIFFENDKATILEASTLVTLDMKNVPVEECLKACFGEQASKYTQEIGTLYIEAPTVVKNRENVIIMNGRHLTIHTIGARMMTINLVDDKMPDLQINGCFIFDRNSVYIKSIAVRDEGAAVYGLCSVRGIIFIIIKQTPETHFNVRLATVIKYLCEIIHFLLHNPCISPKRRPSKP